MPDKLITLKVKLTGTENGTTDIYLPCSSVQAVFRKSSGSRMTAVSAVDFIDDIEARPDGDLVLELVSVTDGVETVSEIGKVNFEDARSDHGSRSQKLTLSGTKSLTTYYTSSASRELFDIAEINELTTGNLEITLSPFNAILPGETGQLYYPYDHVLSDYVIEEISIAASTAGITFAITEIAP